MTFDKQALEWYYTLKAMDEAIENRRHHALFVLNNYQNIKDGKYTWIKNPINKKALIRTIHADIISQAFKSIESLFTIANVGLSACNQNLFNHNSMKASFFDTRWGQIEKNINLLKGNVSIDTWKWSLWIADIEEAKKHMNLNNKEVELLNKIYSEYLERAKFIFNSALEFWNLYKPVRNAFSHTLRFIPSPRISMTGVPNGYDDLLLVFDKQWKDDNPIKIPVITGTRPLKIIAELITNYNLFEQSIIKNHTISIQASSKRLIPVFAIGKENPARLAEYRKLLKKLPMFPAIDVKWDHQFDVEKELKPQFELYEEFKRKLNNLGKPHPYTNFATFFFPRTEENSS